MKDQRTYFPRLINNILTIIAAVLIVGATVLGGVDLYSPVHFGDILSEGI